jgi:chromate transport protein ChrA
LDGVSLCQVIPGATAMRTAAYVGLKARGIAGAAVCFIGFEVPLSCQTGLQPGLVPTACRWSVWF